MLDPTLTEDLTERALLAASRPRVRSLRVLCTPDGELAALELFARVGRAHGLMPARREVRASLPTWSSGHLRFELIVLELAGQRLMSVEIEGEGQALTVISGAAPAAQAA